MEEGEVVVGVETQMGTRFLMPAHPHTPFSHLTELIQHGHLSCFPEHGEIRIVALMVENDGKWYHVLDSLLVGQVLSKRKNKVRVEVSKAPFNLNTILSQPKIAISVGHSDERMRNSCANCNPVKEDHSLMHKDHKIRSQLKMELLDPSLFTQGPCTQPWLNQEALGLHTANEEDKILRDLNFTNIQDKEEIFSKKSPSLFGTMANKASPQVSMCSSSERICAPIQEDGRTAGDVHALVQVDGREEDFITIRQNKINYYNDEHLEKQELDDADNALDITVMRKEAGETSLLKHVELKHRSAFLTSDQVHPKRRRLDKEDQCNDEIGKWCMNRRDCLQRGEVICNPGCAKENGDMQGIQKYVAIADKQASNGIKFEDIGKEHYFHELASLAQSRRKFGEQEIQLDKPVKVNKQFLSGDFVNLNNGCSLHAGAAITNIVFQAQECQLLTQVGVENNNSFAQSSKAAAGMVEDMAASDTNLDISRSSEGEKESRVNILSTHGCDSFSSSKKNKRKRKMKKGRDKDMLQQDSQPTLGVIEERQCTGCTESKEEEFDVASRIIQPVKEFGKQAASEACHNFSTFAALLDAMLLHKHLLDNTVDLVQQSSGFNLNKCNEQAEFHLSPERRKEKLKENTSNDLSNGTREDYSIVKKENCMTNASREINEEDACRLNKNTTQIYEMAIEDNIATHITKRPTEDSQERETHKFDESIEDFQGSAESAGYKLKRHNDMPDDVTFVQDGLALFASKQSPNVPKEHRVVLDIDKCKTKKKCTSKKKCRKFVDETLKEKFKSAGCKRLKDMKKNPGTKSTQMCKKKQTSRDIDMQKDGLQFCHEISSLETDPQITFKDLESDKEKVENCQSSKILTRKHEEKNLCMNKRTAKKHKRSGLISCLEVERNFTAEDFVNHDVTNDWEEKLKFDVFSFSSDGRDESRSQHFFNGNKCGRVKNLDNISSSAVRRVLEDDLVKLATIRDLQAESITKKCNTEAKLRNRSPCSPSVIKGLLLEQTESNVENAQQYNESTGCSIPCKVKNIKSCEANVGEQIYKQNIGDRCQVACPAGCGRLYSRKTSAFYRHKRGCLGEPC